MSDPVLLVTGGSRGIGAATALLAAERGYDVCVNFFQRADAAHAVVQKVRSFGRNAIAVKADVSNEADVTRMYQAIDRQLGPISGLVNNAGILEPQMEVVAMDAQRIRRVLDTNVVGPFICAREAVIRMSTKGGGSGGAIVNVSSLASRTGAPGEYVDYAASKGALDVFTRGLAVEVADEGIRVNAVRPAFIYTEIHASGGEPDRVDRVSGSVPMRRGGSPEEVARAILWLLSEEASYTSGACIEVSGGR